MLLHNYYGSGAPSGENKVFEAEKALLEQNGHDVAIFTRHSDGVLEQGLRGALSAAAVVPWNPFSARAVAQAVAYFKPDVVHAHNTFPLISPSIFHAVGSSAARVLTLHNYRLLCPAAIPMRNGKVCTECIDGRTVRPAIKYGCYRGSRLPTLPVAANVALHRALGTWQQQVDAFIALSGFQKQLMAEGGLPDTLIHVKPNFYAGNPSVVPFADRPNHVVFVGRLGEEKGVRTLVKAWRQWGQGAPLLRIVGDGPLRAELQQEADGLQVEFLGQLSAKAAEEQISTARLLVLPSEWFEGFPMVLREAFAFGTPVAVSDLGPLPSIVTDSVNGVVFAPGNAHSLMTTVANAWNTPDMLAVMGRSARAEFLSKYTSAINHDILLGIYEKAIAMSRQRQ